MHTNSLPCHIYGMHPLHPYSCKCGRLICCSYSCSRIHWSDLANNNNNHRKFNRTLKSFRSALNIHQSSHTVPLFILHILSYLCMCVVYMPIYILSSSIIFRIPFVQFNVAAFGGGRTRMSSWYQFTWRNIQNCVCLSPSDCPPSSTSQRTSATHQAVLVFSKIRGKNRLLIGAGVFAKFFKKDNESGNQAKVFDEQSYRIGYSSSTGVERDFEM